MVKLKAALISQGSVSSKWTLEAMRKYFDEVEEINIKEIEINLGAKKNPILYRGEPLPSYDCVYAKGSFRYAPLLRSIASLVGKSTYKVYEPNSYTVGHDKLLTHQDLQDAGVQMPITYIASTRESAKKILEKVNYPIVLKFPQGTQGKGVMFAESYGSAISVLDALTALNQPFIIQEFIESDGSDIRAFVVGDKVVAAMKRKAVDGEKRSNVHVGGIGEPYKLDNFTKKVAIDAAQAIKAEICGVDILESPSGPKVIEVNLSPGLQGITAATKVDVADKIAKYLFKKTKEMVEKDKKKGAKKLFEDEGISGLDEEKEIITFLDFRGGRILLPEIISKITNFDDKDEIVLRVKNGKLTVEKFKL